MYSKDTVRRLRENDPFNFAVRTPPETRPMRVVFHFGFFARECIIAGFDVVLMYVLPSHLNSSAIASLKTVPIPTP